MALPTELLGVVAILGLLAASAFFSSSETAIFSLPASSRPGATGDDAGPDTGAHRGADDARSSVLASLRNDPHRLLVTILVGNTVVNVALSSVVTVLVAARFDSGAAIAVTTIVASLLVLVFGEIVPKAYGLGNAEVWSLRVARPIRLLERVGSPLISLFDGVTRRIAGLLGGELAIERPYLE